MRRPAATLCLSLAALLAAAGSLAAGAMPALAGGTTTTLYVATAGSDSNNNCQVQASPCQTIGHAVAQAETDHGAVAIQIGSGTYPEQVTIAPPSTSPMTSLILQGPTSGEPAVVRPTSLGDNVTELSTGHFFDNNSGSSPFAVGAIIGVQTGSKDEAAGGTTTGNNATITISGLTVSGAGATSLPPSGQLMGIAFVDTSGSITGNTVESIEQKSTIGQADVEGIQVKATAVAASVTVSGNTVRSDGGHVYVDLMAGASGSLTATVSGNILTGDPTTAMTPVAQFGVTAGGLTSLSVWGNLITNFQSPWSVGAVWLDSQAPGAACSVTSNDLVGNDNGVDLHGATGCSISYNAISAGATGVEIGPGYSSWLPSVSNTVSGNWISGTTTVSTTLSGDYATSPFSTMPSVAGAPVDGVLVWDGTGNAIAHNVISAFVTDAYVGEDPVYLNNTAAWSSGIPSWAASLVIANTTVHYNDLGALATPAAGSGVSGYGAACLNSTGQCTNTALDATSNWWGSPQGPTTSTGHGHTGVPVSAHVDYVPWCRNATCAVLEG